MDKLQTARLLTAKARELTIAGKGSLARKVARYSSKLAVQWLDEKIEGVRS